MNCVKCDTENLDSAKFCKQCGCNLNEKEIGQKEQELPNKFFSGKNKYIIIAVIAVGLFGAGASAMFLKNGTIDFRNFGLDLFEEEKENDNEEINIEMSEESEESDNKDNETNLAIDEDENVDMSDIKDSSSDLDNSDQLEEDENFEITTIEKYYSFLSNNNLEEAYRMRSDQTAASYNQFKDWYEGAQYLKPYDFDRTNSDSYKFYVEYKDRNNVTTIFEVEMSVIENKIKTLSSVEVVEEEGQNEESQDDDIIKAAREYLEEYISKNATGLKITSLEIQIKKNEIALVICRVTQDSYEMESVSVVVELEDGLWKGQEIVAGGGMSLAPCKYPDLYSKEEVDDCNEWKEKYM